MPWAEDQIKTAHEGPVIPFTVGDVPFEKENRVAVPPSPSEANEKTTYAQKPGHLSANVHRGWPARTKARESISHNFVMTNLT